VGHFGERGSACRCDPLCWRVRGHQVGVLGLQRLEFAKERVIVRIRDLGVVGLVVAPVVEADESAEFVDPFAGPVHGPILPMPRGTLRNGL